MDPMLGFRDRMRGRRYLIVAPVPWQADDRGGIWLDALWAQDLLRHGDYLPDLAVLAPRQPWGGAPPPGFVRLDGAAGWLRFRALPAPAGAARSLLGLPAAALATLRAVAGADIVHSGAAGWPLPPGILANPLAVLLRRRLVIVIESAFWRAGDSAAAGRKARLRHRLTEAFARWSVRRADLAVFTHAGYRDTLATGARGRLIVTPASWLDAGDVLAPAAAEAAWDAKPDVPRFLYAGRLVAEKGVGVLLEALARLDAAGRPVAVDVMGEGGMAAAVAAGAARLQHAALTRRDPLPYGAPFLGALRGYHAVIVPSLSDEQPRILYDAFSQAVPAIASDTPGHRAVIGDAPCAVLVPAGDAGALAAALDAAAADGPGLRRSGLAALAVAEGRTHRAMHLARAAVLADLFGRPPS